MLRPSGTERTISSARNVCAIGILLCVTARPSRGGALPVLGQRGDLLVEFVDDPRHTTGMSFGRNV